MTAEQVWLLLVSDAPRDPYRALDLVMEGGRGRERGEALEKLCGAAADWARARLPAKSPHRFKGECQRLAKACELLGACLPNLALSCFANEYRRYKWQLAKRRMVMPNDQIAWAEAFVWFAGNAELAASVLRELTALHEALT